MFLEQHGLKVVRWSVFLLLESSVLPFPWTSWQDLVSEMGKALGCGDTLVDGSDEDAAMNGDGTGEEGEEEEGEEEDGEEKEEEEEEEEAEAGEKEDGKGKGDAEGENEAAKRNNLQERFGARAGKGTRGLQLLAMATAKENAKGNGKGNGILKKPAAAKENAKGNGKAKVPKSAKGKGGKGKGAKESEDGAVGGHGDGAVGREAGKLVVLISCSTCCVLWFL